MHTTWDDRLATGVEWQDRQHRELFRRMDNLLDAIDDGAGMEDVSRLFVFLDEYFIVHFEAEEQAMNRNRFPGLIEHLSEHLDFIERVKALERECGEDPAPEARKKIQKVVADWFVNHVATTDHVLGRFIIEAGKREEKAGEKV